MRYTWLQGLDTFPATTIPTFPTTIRRHRTTTMMMMTTFERFGVALLATLTACTLLAPPPDPIHVHVVDAYRQPTPDGDRYFLVIEHESESLFERDVVQVNLADWVRSRHLLEACMWPAVGGGVRVGPC